MTQNDFIKISIGLIIGLVVIVYFNPLHTPCQSQLDIYFENLKPLIKIYKQNSELCKQHTEAGGCLPFLETMTKIESKIKEVGNQCEDELKSDSKTKIILTNAMELIIRAAWGSKAPASYIYKSGWLEISHVALYCRLKKTYEKIYGADAFADFSSRLMTELPGSETIDRTEVWNRSLLSDPCKYSF